MKGKTDFQDGGHPGFPMGTIVAIFYLQVTQILSFESTGLSVQETKDNHGGHLVFQIGTILAILIFKLPRYFQPILESIGLSVQEKKCEIDFHDGGYLGFPIGTIFATSYQVLCQ